MKVREYSLKINGEEKITENFKVKEFACKDGNDKILIDIQLICLLQEIRRKIGFPITIISGYRTIEYNKQINGATNSYHCQGRAIDLQCKNINIYELAMLLVRIGINGIIIYPQKKFIHIDNREKPYFKVELGETNEK